MADAPDLPSGLRIYAIGDVHGRIDLLAGLLAAIRLDNAQRPAAEVILVLLGDLIDRGPSSAALVEQCMAFTRRYQRFVVLKGNHEAMLVDAMNGSFPALAFWLRHGGAQTLASWGVPADVIGRDASRDHIAAAKELIPDTVLTWLKNLPLTYRRGNCLFVHAGIRPGVPLAKQDPVDLLWIREDFIGSTAPSPFVVVHGHTIITTEPVLCHGRIGVDTGAFRTGRLSAVGLEGDRFWSLAADDGAGSRERPVVDSIEDSIEAILGHAPLPPPRQATAGRLAVAGGAALAVTTLAVLGTTWESRRPAASATATAVPPPTTQRHGLAQPAQHFSPSTPPLTSSTPATSSAGSASIAGIGMAPATSGAALPAAISAPQRAIGSRSISSSPLAAAAPGDHLASPGKLSPDHVAPPAPAPTRVIPPALADNNGGATPIPATGAVALRPPSLVSAPTARPVEETPPPAEKAKRRQEALDAIKALRRQ